MANVLLQNTTMQTMIVITVTKTNKKLITAARAAMIAVLSCTCCVVIPSWLIAAGDIIDFLLYTFS